MREKIDLRAHGVRYAPVGGTSVNQTVSRVFWHHFRYDWFTTRLGSNRLRPLGEARFRFVQLVIYGLFR